ncbi:molecular chaperone HtpG [Buchnera aphidicola (Neophyllaphis varicolor)]|uniref:molecular chaperone HtpG n=1 Tax=Buchnera aphidicola TaxID=9 RepID=UPI0031B7EC4A
MKENKTYKFKSEVKQLLNLMINSLYSNKEIFMRELISNASDAIDKLRFKIISEPKIYKNNNENKIRISVNKDNKTLIIKDNGIGMSYDEVIENLGTIAKSGTKSFIESLTSNKDNNNQLIGKFGVGFYSSFIVSKKVQVKTRSAKLKKEEGVCWESKGEGEYSIKKIIKEDTGTEIILSIKKENIEFLDTWKIQSIIHKYSDHISIPVELQILDEKNKDPYWKQINQATALWTKEKSNISEKEYQEFYKYISKDSNAPIYWTHNKVEGNQEYINLLYIPSKAPWDIWNRENKHGLKLYVKRVYIMDDAEQFLPNYLRFIKGLIDSDDLPLNISREILQDSSLINKLKKSLTNRSLKMLETLYIKDKKKYEIFWKEFGLVLKEGIAEDLNNKDKIAKLIRFASIKNKSNIQNLSLDDYINNMLKNQEKIYFITADSYNSAINSPHLEFFKKESIDVLLLSDKIDEWMMSYLTEYKGKKFQSVSKKDESLKKILDIKENKKTEKVNFKMSKFLENAKKILGDKVKDVSFTDRLIKVPSIVITDNDQISTQMAKLFASAGQKVPEIKYIFQINPNHFLIKEIIEINNEENLSEWINLLLEQALFIEKGTLNDPNKFINRTNKLMEILFNKNNNKIIL